MSSELTNLTKEEIAETAEGIRKQGKTIVTTNGSFDIIHAGHVKYLREAREQGDVLIVGLNSDASVKRNKGEGRPIFNEKDRAQVLAAFWFVDYITIFNETDPRNFIKNIKPDVHVNGEEYGEDCIEAKEVKQSGRLHLVRRDKGYSTTDIIKRIKNEHRFHENS